MSPQMSRLNNQEEKGELMAYTGVGQNEREGEEEGLNKEEGEWEEGTTINTFGVGDSIADINRLVSFLRFTQKFSPGMLGETNLEKVVKVIETTQIKYSSLEDYVNKNKKSKVPFTQTQAKQLHRELNTCVDRSTNKQTNKQKTEIISLFFIKKLLAKYYEMGELFLNVKKELQLRTTLKPTLKKEKEPQENVMPSQSSNIFESVQENNAHTSETVVIVKQEPRYWQLVAGQNEYSSGKNKRKSKVDNNGRAKRSAEQPRDEPMQPAASSDSDYNRCVSCDSILKGETNGWDCILCKKTSHSYCKPAQKEPLEPYYCYPCWTNKEQWEENKGASEKETAKLGTEDEDEQVEKQTMDEQTSSVLEEMEEHTVDEQVEKQTLDAQVEKQTNLNMKMKLDEMVNRLLVCDFVANKKIWRCAQCHYTYKEKYVMRMHIEKHIEGLLYQCPYCTQTCKTRTILRVHVSKKHVSEKQAKRPISLSLSSLSPLAPMKEDYNSPPASTTIDEPLSRVNIISTEMATFLSLHGLKYHLLRFNVEGIFVFFL